MHKKQKKTKKPLSYTLIQLDDTHSYKHILTAATVFVQEFKNEQQGHQQQTQQLY